MIVEDDTVLARASHRILGTEFDVDVFTDGEAAFEALHVRKYAGIVCDVNMGRMSGTDFLRLIRTACPEMSSHFMFYTASVDPHNLRSTLVPVLPKPAHPNDLLTMVHFITRDTT